MLLVQLKLVNYVCDEVFDDEDSESDDDGSPTNKKSSKKESVNFPAAALWVSAVAVMDTLLTLQEREEEDAWVGLPSLLDPEGVLAPPLPAALEALTCITEVRLSCGLLFCPRAAFLAARTVFGCSSRPEP